MRTAICLSLVLVAACGDDSSDVDATVPADMAASGDMTVGPELTGTKVAGGFQLQLLTVNDNDDLIISSSPMMKGQPTLAALPAAGGTPTTINANWSNAVAFATGVVLVWDTVSGSVGNLGAWTRSGGLKMLSTTASTNVFPAINGDKTLVFYASNANTDATLGDLYVAGIDGSSPKLITAQQPTETSCEPLGVFTTTKLVVSYCNAAVDAGVRTSTVVSVDTATGTPTTLFTDARSDYRFAVDNAGTKVFTIDALDNAKVIDIGGGSITSIEGSVQNGFVTKDGAAFVYQTMGGALKRATLASPTTGTTLVAANVHGFQPSPFLSDDGSLLLFYDMQSGPTTNVVRDLYLADTTTANQTAVAIDSAAETQLYGDPISADKSRVVFFTNTMNGVGTMKSAPAAGGAPTTIATKVWLTKNVSATKYLYNDAYKGPTTGNGRADLKVTDVASAGSSTVIATQAHSDSFFMTKDHSKVAYLYDFTATEAGIYVAPIP